MVKLTFLGAAGTVTGSKHLVESGGKRLLVDCGMFQGLKNLRERNWQPLPVDAADIDAVVLTHAHLDHTGYLPRLVRDGFRGPVYCTPGTADLAALILRDAAYLQEQDAALANRHGFSKHRPAAPLYTRRDAEAAIALFQHVPFHEPTELPLGARLLYRRAGHILGAATVQLEWGGRMIVFSGDLGRYADPLMFDPEPVPEADAVVVESTYGDRLHGDEDPVEALAGIAHETTGRGGTLVIPSFAVGRAQLLLHALWQARKRGLLPHRIPVYLDSPMSIGATSLYAEHPEDHRLTPEQTREAFGVATYVADPHRSRSLSADQAPKIVIAASGMATGGRVLHHLAAFAPQERNTVLFSGFQAAGTRGRKMLRGDPDIKIHGAWVPVRAEVRELTMLSAHGDAAELLRWLGGFRRPPSRAFIVHGEPDASEAMRQHVRRRLGWEAHAPLQNQSFTL
ncbi:MBL fold metallo-hydrolase RNA specificity domain-containing protein [Zafaria sp. Z1313]|uniref:MBL fold metallo-hydrolase n=1 Tax=unclassified Zafaria TaxID=2828765 RepID=UPI002E7686D7|nr:MBL fold metallo-hydrolase [Zafaria sp. J156]MEE1621841.1 MBL fold metallo-hydrolase [Zafaria sp. J156]